MSGFNESSAQQDMPAGGSEIAAEANPQTVTGGTDHTVGEAGGLPWYFANKFGYRNNKSGVGRHIAPHDSYVQDVLREGLAQAELFRPTEKSVELDSAMTELGLVRKQIEVRNEFDIDDDGVSNIKMEAKDVLRGLRTRYLLCLKIAGANHVDRMYRIEHAQLNDWDINRTTENANFITSGTIRDKWARKAGYYGFIIDMLAADYNEAGIDLNLEGGVRQALYQDARDVSQNLSKPPVVAEPGATIDKADLSALAA